MSRYNGRDRATNKNDMYKEVMENRGVNQVIQYRTPILNFPSEEEIRSILTIDHIWVQGDKFWRLASSNYGDPRLWWVIAQFNRKPTEGHLNPGDVIKIPINLSEALGVLT
jgi:nucleoid-associated protein YgaU